MASSLITPSCSFYSQTPLTTSNSSASISTTRLSLSFEGSNGISLKKSRSISRTYAKFEKFQGENVEGSTETSPFEEQEPGIQEEEAEDDRFLFYYYFVIVYKILVYIYTWVFLFLEIFRLEIFHPDSMMKGYIIIDRIWFMISAACHLIWWAQSSNQVKQVPCLFLQEG